MCYGSSIGMVLDLRILWNCSPQCSFHLSFFCQIYNPLHFCFTSNSGSSPFTIDIECFVCSSAVSVTDRWSRALSIESNSWSRRKSFEECRGCLVHWSGSMCWSLGRLCLVSTIFFSRSCFITWMRAEISGWSMVPIMLSTVRYTSWDACQENRDRIISTLLGRTRGRNFWTGLNVLSEPQLNKQALVYD